MVRRVRSCDPTKQKLDWRQWFDKEEFSLRFYRAEGFRKITPGVETLLIAEEVTSASKFLERGAYAATNHTPGFFPNHTAQSVWSS